MASLSDFTRRINVIAKGVEENSDKLVRKVAVVIDRLVVTETPVDEGTARSNWLVSTGAPRTDTIDAYSPGKDGNTGDANSAAAIAQGAAEIGARKNGQDIYISNNLPYIGELNAGSSAQAPANYVEKAVQAATQVVENTKVVP